MKSFILFLRNFTTSFLIILFVFLPTIQAKAEQMSAYGSIVGKSGPVLTAITTCTINLIISAVKQSGTTLEDEAVKQAELAIPVRIAGTTSPKNDATTKLKNTDSDFEKYCVNPIAKAAGQVLIAYATQLTVDWINSGFDGKAAFPQSLDDMLNGMKKKALGDLSAKIGDNEGAFPFGKATLKSILTGVHSTFDNSAKSDMSKILSKQGFTTINFGAHLTDGGWDAFNGAFKENNNPIGFLFQTKEELGRQTKNTDYDPATDLKNMIARGNGFMDQRKCVNPSTFNKLRDDPSKCLKWQTVTPGSIISDQLKTALGSQNKLLTNSSVFGGDLNASLTLIFDSLMSELTKEGLACLAGASGNLWNCPSSPDYVPSEDPGTSDANPIEDGAYTNDQNQTNTTQSDIIGGSVCGQTNSGDWRSAYPRFDLLAPDTSTTTGIQGLIIKEERFWMLIHQQNEVIDMIIPAIYQLDYCIPGPHPIDSGLETTAVNDIMTKFNDYDDLKETSGTILSVKHAQFFNDVLGVKVMPNEKIVKMTDVQKIVKNMVHNYILALKEEYKNNIYLSSYGQSVAEFNKIPYYQQIYSDNQEKMKHTSTVISQLKMIQSRVDGLSPRKAYITDTSTGITHLNMKYDMVNKMFNNIIPDLDVAPY